MASEQRTKWTCDRCKTEREEYATNQPSGWGHVAVSAPPKAVPTIGMDLCSTCLVDVDVFLKGDVTKKGEQC